MPELESELVGRPRKQTDEGRVNISVTIPESMKARVLAIRDRYPRISASDVVTAALERTIEAIEADPLSVLEEGK